jgi:hypothetical protein
MEPRVRGKFTKGQLKDVLIEASTRLDRSLRG